MAKNHLYSASNKIQGTLNNHGFSLNGNSFQGSILYFGDKSASAEEDCRKALFLTNPVDDRGEVETNKPPLVRKVCDWIHNHANFKAWTSRARDSQLLWISGGSGMGKTMMSLFLLRELERGQAPWGAREATILFYFIDTRNEKRNTAVSILRGLIHLLLRARPDLMNHLLPDFEVQRESLFAQTSLEALWRIFAAMLRDPATGPVYCLIDGLDECREDSLQRLLRKVTDFFEEESYRREVACTGHAPNMVLANVKMILVSREAPDCIAETLANYPRINIAAATAGKDGSKPKAKSESKPTAKPSKPAAKLSTFAMLALQKKRLGLDAHPVQPAAQTSLPDRLAGLTLAGPGVDSAVQQTAAELPAGDCIAPIELPSTPHSATAVPANDAYVFDEPVEDEDQDVLAEPATTESAETVLESSEEEEGGEESSEGALDHYIDAKVAEVSQEMGYDNSLAAVVSAGLRGKGDGTFLWVDLAVSEIKRYKAEHVAQVVEELSPGVDDMYCRTLQQIAPNLVPLAIAVLRWVLAARRPMYLSELSAALVLMGFHSFNPAELAHQGIVACGSLLALKDDTTVHIPHTSVKDLLTAKAGPLWNDAGLHPFYVDVSQIDGEIAGLCIRYLEQGCLRAGPVSGTATNQTEMQQRIAQFPFMAYAVDFWPVHLRSASNPQIDLASPFFVSKSVLRKNWWLTYYPSTTGKVSLLAPRDFNLLHMAAYLNIPYIAYQMELRGSLHARLNSKDSHGSTPLSCAAAMGNMDMFVFLLQRGADQQCIGESNVYFEACWKGQCEVAEYLLNLGYDVNERSPQPDTMKTLKMLGQSARWAHGIVSEGMKLDRDYWKLVLRDVGYGETALHTAASFGHTALMKMLLSRGASVDILTTKGWSALHSAAWTGQLECIKILLQHGANAVGVTDFGWNALHCAASRGKTPVVSFLLEYGMPVDTPTQKQKAALHLAAYGGSAATVKVLVGAGAAIDAQSYKAETPLHLATRSTKPEAVEALLALGANRLIANGAGQSPVMTMKIIKGTLTEDQKEVVRILETFGMPGYVPWKPKVVPTAAGTQPAGAAPVPQNASAPGIAGSAATPAPTFQAQFQFVSQTTTVAQARPSQPTAHTFPMPPVSGQLQTDEAAPPPYSPPPGAHPTLEKHPDAPAPIIPIDTKPKAATETPPVAFTPMASMAALAGMTPSPTQGGPPQPATAAATPPIMPQQQTGLFSSPQPGFSPGIGTPASSISLMFPPPPSLAATSPSSLVAQGYLGRPQPPTPGPPSYATAGSQPPPTVQYQPPGPAQFQLTPPPQGQTPVLNYGPPPYSQPQAPSAYPFPAMGPRPAPSPAVTPTGTSWEAHQAMQQGPAAYNPAYNAAPYPPYPGQPPAAPQQYSLGPAVTYQQPGPPQPQFQQQQASLLSVSYAGPGLFGRQQGGVGAGMQFMPPPAHVPLQKKKSLLSLGGLAERAEQAFR